jgi:DeoR/GlpR family transcriptional regulator of sugar metabolism
LILSALRAHGPSEVAGLSRELGVSDATVRRDLASMAMAGLPDTSKFPGTGIARVCSSFDVAAVVTEPEADAATVARLRNRGAGLLTTGSEGVE